MKQSTTTPNRKIIKNGLKESRGFINLRRIVKSWLAYNKCKASWDNADSLLEDYCPRELAENTLKQLKSNLVDLEFSDEEIRKRSTVLSEVRLVSDCTERDIGRLLERSENQSHAMEFRPVSSFGPLRTLSSFLPLQSKQ